MSGWRYEVVTHGNRSLVVRFDQRSPWLEGKVICESDDINNAEFVERALTAAAKPGPTLTPRCTCRKYHQPWSRCEHTAGIDGEHYYDGRPCGGWA